MYEPTAARDARFLRIVMLVVFAAALGRSAGASQSEPIVVSMTIPAESPKVIPGDEGSELRVEGFGNLHCAGEPALPSKIFAIGIPPGSEVAKVTFDLGAEVVLPGTYRVAPAKLSRVIGEEDPALYARDLQRFNERYEAVYGSDDAYPSLTVEPVRQAGYRKYDLVDVRVTPVAYHPKSGRLSYYSAITVHVHCEPASAPKQAIVDSLAKNERIAREIVANYDQAAGWHPQTDAAAKGLYDFVIVTLDTLTSAVTPLVNWETSKGRNVNVVTTSWIDANYTGYDLAEKIRNFLREKYPSGEWGIQDVLLIGHYDDVPMRRTAQDVGYGQPETDFYYAELSLPDSESWDSNGNHQWGEDADAIDFYAEVNVGRIPWSQPTTVASICNKSVAFEQNQDPAFKKNMLLLGAFFWWDTDNAYLMEAKIDQPWMSDWTFTRMYEKNTDYSSSFDCDYPLLNSNVMSVWPTGQYAFVNWAGHGSPTSTHIYGLGAPAFIDSSDCPSLSDDYPAIIFADACSNSDTDDLNIGQAMLEHGAVGFVGATKVALGTHAWSSGYDGSSQSLDYFFTTCVTSGEYTQGEALQWGLREMYTHGLWDYNKYETFEWGALWGNPNLRIGPPPIMKIQLPDGPPEYMEPGVATEFTVQIQSGSETYVPGSGMLHYRYDGGVYLTTPLTHNVADYYIATLPGTGCASTPEFYISAQGDGGSTVLNPAAAPSSVYTATVGLWAAVFENPLDVDPGWTTEGLWAFGPPTGGGGEHGGPDPTSGYTGDNVYGYNLSGDYEDELTVEQHLTSAAIDCSAKSNVKLMFQRWLGVEQPRWDHAYVRVSNNGTNWTTVWENEQEVTDTTWQLCEYDISSVADDQPSVYVRWTMGTTDTSYRYCGWNIDDVEVWALDTSFETCADGVLNQGEERIDCGGPCPPCECLTDEECGDGLYCNGGEVCDVLGHCGSGAYPCPGQMCDDAGDACVDIACTTAPECDDGLYCNGIETCVGDVCQPGTPIDCGDGIACTVDSCDEVADTCVNLPSATRCDDGLYCNGVEICDALTGCQGGAAIECGDDVDCTVDSCNELLDTCNNIPSDAACDNALFCDGAETCDPVAGCLTGVAPCVPDQMCRETDDQCVECVEDKDCPDDGDLCNGAEVCTYAGDCTHTPVADCNENGVEDECDILDGTSEDCQPNGVPDVCDLDGGGSADENGNDIPDECEAEPPLAAPAPYDISYNRYIAFIPNNSSAVALRVEVTGSVHSPDSVGVFGWVGQQGPDSVSQIVSEPYFSDFWPAVVRVADCLIVPAATYSITATTQGTLFSEPLEVMTTPAPLPKAWADVVGEFTGDSWSAPDGLVGMNDIMATVQRFQAVPTAPPTMQVDVDGQTPNRVINMTDVLQVVNAYQGEPYPFSDPAGCP